MSEDENEEEDEDDEGRRSELGQPDPTFGDTPWW